jgi:drug/metabolite transporter (DMT)-like permease
VLAAVLLGVVATLMRLRFPRGRALLVPVLYGALSFGASIGLASYALVRVHAGLAQMIFAVVPLAAVLLSALERLEPLRTARVAGGVLALIGIAAISRGALDRGIPLVSLLALLAGALAFAQGTVVVRLFEPIHPIVMNAIGMGVAAVLLTAVSAATGEAAALPHHGETIAAVTFLVPSMMLTFLLYLFVVERWSASRASYAFVLSPLVSLALSALLDSEPIEARALVGGLLVVVGVYVGALRGPNVRARADARRIA